MAVGTDGLVDFTLIGGKTVSLNVGHISSIEKLTRKELQTANFKKYGSAIKSFTKVSSMFVSLNAFANFVDSDLENLTLMSIGNMFFLLLKSSIAFGSS